jgi:hypothetical protein
MATQPELAISDAAAENGAAQQLFRERVKLLPDVLRVEEHEGATTSLPSFRIYVSHGDRETQYAVYELEAEAYQRYPGAFLDVQVLVDAAGHRSDGSPQANAQ